MYLAEIDFPRSMDKIEQLVSTLENSTDIIKSVDSWYPAFKEFSNSNLNSNIPDEPLDNATFNADLTQFLYNADLNTLGLRFIPNFQSNEGEIVCGEPAPNILLSTFTFKHIKFNGRDEHIPALNKVKKIIDDCHFDGLVFPFNQVEKFIIFYCFQISFSSFDFSNQFTLQEYSNWETDAVITKELLRNLGIALACVFVTTLILLADILGSIMVLITVALSLVDLCGFMHTWDITIDVVSSINVILAVGRDPNGFYYRREGYQFK